jgi:alpha-N-acetylglucosaminidase
VANCAGVGSTLEGLNVNPVAYDLLFEQPWHTDGKPDLAQWVDAYANRRAGRPDPANLKAWRMLADKVFVDNAMGIRGHGIILEAVPKIRPYTRWADPKIPYEKVDLVAALGEMLKADPTCAQSDGYQFDVVNLTRQVLGNYSATVHARMMRAYEEKDLPAFRAAAERFLAIGRDLDALLGTRHEFLLGRWLADARRWAADPAEARYYERNARQIITTWHKPGGELSDYAHRQWNGLLGSYYLPRWQEFIARLDRSLADNQPLDAESYDRWRVEFERQWLESTAETFPVDPDGDPAATARRLYDKYGTAELSL